MTIRRRDRAAAARSEPGQTVQNSTVRGANVQVGGDVDGPIVAGDLTVRFDVHVPGTSAPPFHDRYAAIRNAFASYHADVLDREVELHRLLDAFRAPGSYHLLEAPAFTGKTALIVELYRRLRGTGFPTAVFYVRHRYSNRSGDFLDAVTGQLIGILRTNEPIAPANERHAQFLRLWDDFAALGTEEQPAVLLVDGLDEQWADDAIGPLLPEHISGHAHIVVSTRSLPNPRSAVPRQHPLGAAHVDVMPLTPSRHATSREDDAKRHLEGYLTSADPVREQIAAFLLVAGAPLSRHDLADLLGSTVGQVTRQLYDVERCLLLITTEAGEAGYVWGHATYSQFVHDWVGPTQRGEAVRRIAEWATQYAAAGWPETTPSFLLHGLHDFAREYRALASPDFLAALVSHSRRQCLLVRFGHDRLFLESIAVAQQLLEPDGPPPAEVLEQLFRLEVHHVVAATSIPFPPAGLFRLLVLSGRPEQAEGIAHSLEARYRAGALAEVSEALVDLGDRARAEVLADLSWQYAENVEDDYWKLVTLLECARAARKAGTTLRLPPLEPFLCAGDPRLTIAVAHVLLEIEAYDDARAALDELPRLSRAGTKIYNWVWAKAAHGRSILGDLDATWTAAKTALADKNYALTRGPELAVVVKHLFATGRADRAVELARTTDANAGDSELWASLQAALVEGFADTDREHDAHEHLQGALAAAASIENPHGRTSCQARLRAAQAATGNAHRHAIHALVGAIEQLGGTDGPRSIVRLGLALLQAGHNTDAERAAQRALALNRRLSTPFADYSMHDLCCALIESGDRAGAREVAETNPNMAWRTPSIRTVELAEVAAGASPPDHRRWPADDRARLAVAMASVEDTRQQALALATELVEAVTPGSRYSDNYRSHAALIAVDALHRASDIDACETVLSKIKNVPVRAEALAKLSGLCRASDIVGADRLFASAVRVACRTRSADKRLSALYKTVRAAGSLSPATPGMPRLVAAAQRALTGVSGQEAVEVASSLAIALQKANCVDHARVFARLAQQEMTETAREGSDELSRAIASIGDYETAISLTQAQWFAMNDVARIAADNGDFATASRIAMRLCDASKNQLDRYGRTATLLDTLLRAARPDLALSSFTGRYHWEDRHAYGFFRELADRGYGNEALAASRKIERHDERIAALIGWAAAPVWPPEVRTRNLRLLKESVMAAYSR